MKYTILAFLCLFILSGCADTEKGVKNNSAAPEEVSSKDKQFDIGEYLFNADKMETIEISGKDLLQKKKAELSTEIITGKKIDLAIKLDDYNFGFSLIIYSENLGIDMSSNLEKSVKKGCAPKEDFYYQMASYDFDHDGEKEIIVAGGNKKDTLELNIFRLNLDLDFEKNEPQLLAEINDGYKAYVNGKDEICVIDSNDDISVYSYRESGK